MEEAAAARGAASALQPPQVSALGGSVAVPGWCRLAPRGLPQLLFCKDVFSVPPPSHFYPVERTQL